MMGSAFRAKTGPYDFAASMPPIVIPYGHDDREQGYGAPAPSMATQMPSPPNMAPTNPMPTRASSMTPTPGMFGNSTLSAASSGTMGGGSIGANPRGDVGAMDAIQRPAGMPAPDLSSGFAGTTAPQFRKPTFFQHGGAGEKILQTLGEVGLALSASNGDPYATMMLQNRFQERAAQRRAQMQMLEPREVAGNLVQYDPQTGQYKTVYSAPLKPANNDTANDYAFIAQHLGQDAADQFLSNLGDPMVTIPLADGQVYSGPRSGLATALTGGPPQASAAPAADGQRKPVGKLTPIGGGASPTGSRTFPVR